MMFAYIWDVAVGWGIVGGGGAERGIWHMFCARLCGAHPLVPRIGEKGQQTGDFRGFGHPGGIGGKQERNCLEQNLLFVHLCAV